MDGVSDANNGYGNRPSRMGSARRGSADIGSMKRGVSATISFSISIRGGVSVIVVIGESVAADGEGVGDVNIGGGPELAGAVASGCTIATSKVGIGTASGETNACRNERRLGRILRELARNGAGFSSALSISILPSSLILTFGSVSRWRYKQMCFRTAIARIPLDVLEAFVKKCTVPIGNRCALQVCCERRIFATNGKPPIFGLR